MRTLNEDYTGTIILDMSCGRVEKHQPSRNSVYLSWWKELARHKPQAAACLAEPVCRPKRTIQHQVRHHLPETTRVTLLEVQLSYSPEPTASRQTVTLHPSQHLEKGIQPKAWKTCNAHPWNNTAVSVILICYQVVLWVCKLKFMTEGWLPMSKWANVLAISFPCLLRSDTRKNYKYLQLPGRQHKTFCYQHHKPNS